MCGIMDVIIPRKVLYHESVVARIILCIYVYLLISVFCKLLYDLTIDLITENLL